MPTTCRYDVFISYRHGDADESFALDLLKKLEAAGYKVALDQRDFAPHEPFLKEMERCIKESRFTLAVVSPRYRQSGNCEEEALITTVLDMSERRRRLIPLVIEKVEMPTWIYLVTGLDFATPNLPFDPFGKLLRTLGNPL